MCAGVALASLLASSACSGASESLLNEAPGLGTSSVTDASTEPTAHDSSTPAAHDSGSPVKPDPDASAVDPGQPDSAQAISPPDDASAAKDTSPPPPATGIACGSAKCDPTSQVCCITGDGHGGASFACGTTQDCNSSGGLALPCATAADCVAAGSPAGTVCCVTEGNGNGGGGSGGGGPGTGNPEGASNVACVPALQCADPSSQAWMCDPKATSATECPPGETCTVSTSTIPPYSICK